MKINSLFLLQARCRCIIQHSQKTDIFSILLKDIFCRNLQFRKLYFQIIQLFHLLTFICHFFSYYSSIFDESQLFSNSNELIVLNIEYSTFRQRLSYQSRYYLTRLNYQSASNSLIHSKLFISIFQIQHEKLQIILKVYLININKL